MKKIALTHQVADDNELNLDTHWMGYEVNGVLHNFYRKKHPEHLNKVQWVTYIKHPTGKYFVGGVLKEGNAFTPIFIDGAGEMIFKFKKSYANKQEAVNWVENQMRTNAWLQWVGGPMNTIQKDIKELV